MTVIKTYRVHTITDRGFQATLGYMQRWRKVIGVFGAETATEGSYWRLWCIYIGT